MKKAFHILRTFGPATFAGRAWRATRAAATNAARALSERFAGRYAADLPAALLPFAVPTDPRPDVSIVVAATDSAVATARTIRAAARSAPALRRELIAVLRDGTAESERFLRRCRGLQIVDSRDAASAGAALDAAAARAKAPVICFVRDAILDKRALGVLAQAIRGDVAGAVPQVRARSGRVLEAGPQDDGHAYVQLTRHADRRDPSIAYVRDASLSGTVCAVSRSAFELAGGFGAARGPWEGALALSLALRAAGGRIIYHPGAAAYALRARPQVPAPPTADAAPPPHDPQRTILFVDEFVPFYDRGAGARRAFELMRIMQRLGYHVVFVPEDGKLHEPYASALAGSGVEIARGRAGDMRTVAKNAPRAGIAWLSRPALCAKYLPVVRAASQATVIYDTVDLHHVRLQGAHSFARTDGDPAAMRALELDLATRCDRTIVTTQTERELLLSEGVRDCVVVPVIQQPRQSAAPPFSQRRGLLFVGNYTHAPNEDAAVWFCEDILPRVRKHDAMPVTLAGADPTRRVQALRGSGVSVPGFRATLAPLFDTHRIFIAPLRYGAGIKGKVVEALAMGVPVVLTPVAAQGIGLRHGHDALICDTASEFAGAIVRLHGDAALWESLAQAGLAAARAFSPDAVLPLVRDALAAPARIARGGAE